MKTAEEIAESVYPEKDGEFTAHLKQLLKADIEAYALSVAETMVKAASEDLPKLSKIVSDKYLHQLVESMPTGTVVIVGGPRMTADISEPINQIRRNCDLAELLTPEPITISVIPVSRETVNEKWVERDRIPCPKPYRKRGY